MGGHMDGSFRSSVRALVLAAVAFGALILGYLWGYGVGEREGQDSDPDLELGRDTRARRMYEMGYQDAYRDAQQAMVGLAAKANGG